MDEATEQTARAQAEKMAAMSKLAAGVAHEINNPCGVLLMKLKFLLSIAAEESLSPRAVSTLEVAVEQTERIETIVQQLVRFSRPTQSMPRPVDVAQVVDGVLASVESPGVEVQVDVDDGMPPVTADPDQLTETVAAVVSNALDAMPSGGTLRVSARRPASGAILYVEIADTGGGIPADFVDRIFDPFFTTKSVGNGTGLGLTIAYGVVQRLGGEITVDSERGRGTRVQISLPVGTP